MTAEIIIANLDAETTWARRARHKVGDLPRGVRKRISLYGTLLRVLWPDVQRLWTPLPVDPACMRDVPGLSRPTLVSGELERCFMDESAAVGWACAPPGPGHTQSYEAAGAVNHRRFAQELRERAGILLPDSRFVSSIALLKQHPAVEGAWVAKAPFATAGRARVFGRGADLDDATIAHATRLLQIHGELLVEPWLPRDLDLGRATSVGFRDSRTHVLHVDSRGRFNGITVGSPAAQGRLGRSLARMAAMVSDQLADRGYTGPFGIDAFRYLTPDGESTLYPLVEINARHTFGHVAHALYDSVARHAWGAAPGPVTLQFGDEPELAGNPNCLALAGAADGSRMYAWLRRSAATTLPAP